jgi:nucleotide-binding universal stress UspA family protein
MLPISRILFPVDFSKRCLGMLPYVRGIAEKYDAEVVLLHVVNPEYAIPETGVSGPAVIPMPQYVVEDRSRQLNAFAVAELEKLRVRRLLVYEGDPDAQIAALARSEDVQLLIIPTHGYGVFRRFLIGSVTAKVLHDVSCPVLTGVHMETHDPSEHMNFSRIACAIDLKPESGRILGWASRLAGDFRAKLSVVHVRPPVSSGVEITPESNIRDELARIARNDSQRLQADLGGDSIVIRIHEGDVADSVCSFAKDNHANLLVIGRGALEDKGERLRTTAYTIIRHSPCPVLSI